MGEYRLSIYAKWQLGLSIGFQYGKIEIRLPFLDIYVSIRSYARGFGFFTSWVITLDSLRGFSVKQAEKLRIKTQAQQKYTNN